MSRWLSSIEHAWLPIGLDAVKRKLFADQSNDIHRLNGPLPGTLRRALASDGPRKEIVKIRMMNSMMSWMMGLGMLGWVLAVALLIIVIVLLARLASR